MQIQAEARATGEHGAAGGNSHVELRDVHKYYGAVKAVDGVSFQIERGTCLSLLGPSGCGKTTTLNLIAGFLEPDAGSISIGGRSIERVPAHRRNIGMVFQNYALFPHMTVFQNIAFGLEMRKRPRDEIVREVGRILDLVRLQEVEQRYPRQLSGGQQQRVALARALVIQPDVLLLDEPLSNLDAKLREQMRLELVEIRKQLGVTTIFVTHDQAEALVIADKVAVMNAGQVEQFGSPTEIYEDPRTRFVAGFIGRFNFLSGKVVALEDGRAMVQLSGGDTVASTRARDLKAGEAVTVMVRPERVRLTRAPASAANQARVTLERHAYLGSEIHYYLDLGGERAEVITQNTGHEALVEDGTTLYAEWDAQQTLVRRYEG